MDNIELEANLINEFADSLCLAVEQLPAEIIIKCLRAAITESLDYHEAELGKYQKLLDAVQSP